MDTAVYATHEWGQQFPALDDDGIRRFAKEIGDHNPIHHDNEAAQAAGLKGIVAPGVMILGLVSATIAGFKPGTLICSLEMKFKRPLYAGFAPSVTCKVVENLEGGKMKVAITVSNGEKPVLIGSCVLKVPAAA